MIKLLISIDTGYACGGIIINGKGKVIQTCPIYKWMLDKPIKQVLKWHKIKQWHKVSIFK